MNPKVSVVVPCWNVEKYLDRCIESLINQTLKDIEIVLVDDVSSDKTPKICDEWKKRDSRIVVVHKTENEGLGYARNTGLEHSFGEYVMFLDSDDTFELDACAKMYETAKKYDADVVSGNFITEELPNVWNISHEDGGDVLLSSKDEIYNYILDMISCAPYDKRERLHPVSVCLLCVRKSIVDNNNLRFFSERNVGSEDTLFKINLLKSCNKMFCLSFPFYHYFYNTVSLTHEYNPETLDKIKTLRTHLLQLLDDDDETINRINRFIISDIRSHITRLVNSTQKNKIQCIRNILNDSLWLNIKSYKPSYLGWYARIFYQLCLWKKSQMLYYYVFIAIKLKCFFLTKMYRK